MEKKKKGKNVTKTRTKLNIRFKMIINIIFISILLIGSIFMFMIASDIRVNEEEEIISYSENSDISYTVSLKENSFYTEQNLGMNQQYPSSLIDKINIKYKYDFETSEYSDYSYRYLTTTTLIATNKNNSDENTNLLLSKTEQLEDTVSGTMSNSNSYNITKEYSIDYDTYNDFITTYRNTYNLSVDAYLKVVMYVEVIDNYDGHVINLAKEMEVDIPLISNPISITIKNSDDVSDTLYKEVNSNTNSDLFIAFACVMLITGILLFVQEIRKVWISDKEQSIYISKVNKIMSANSDVIVKVKNKINLTNHNIIEVETIEELLDAQNELRIPIAYYETKSNKEGCFVIVNGKEAWRYILKIEE